MSTLTSRPLIRWAVPAAVAVAVVAAGSLAKLLPASADAVLPPRSAAQLLVDVQTARLDGLSGTVVERSALGLPDLPLPSGMGSSDLTTLVSGTHTLRLWYAGPTKVRVALLGTLGESDVIRNGADLWTWSSDQNTATHRTLPADAGPPDTGAGAASALGLTPQQAAERALAAIDPSTKVTTAGPAALAGRSAYELVLRPRDTSSLVGQVRIAVDAVEHVPLRLQVFARGSDSPAFEVAFTQVSFATPPASEFTFTPPPGVKVTQVPAQQSAQASTQQTPGTVRKPMQKLAPDQSATGPRASAAAGAGGQPHVVGSGWTAVVVAPNAAPAGSVMVKPGQGPQAGPGDQIAMSLDRVLGALPHVSGSWGSGRLLRSALVTVLITDDGRVLAGAVAPDRLYQVAAQPAPATASVP